MNKTQNADPDKNTYETNFIQGEYNVIIQLIILLADLMKQSFSFNFKCRNRLHST